MITKTRMVLNAIVIHSSEDVVRFEYPVDEGEEARKTTLALDMGVWEDMDKPETITVTVERGDKLND